jgi:hypothetical protein
MKLEDARAVAQGVLRLVQPWCKWSSVAGSIRREVADVKDIEIVCVPSWADFQKEDSLLAGDTERVNLLHQALASSGDIRWIKPGVPQVEDWPIKADGRYWRGLIAAGKLGAPADMKLDLFLARPDNVWRHLYDSRRLGRLLSRARYLCPGPHGLSCRRWAANASRCRRAVSR